VVEGGDLGRLAPGAPGEGTVGIEELGLDSI